MKDVRMEVRIARMKRGVKYTALFTKGPDYTPGLLSALDGKRVTIKNIGYGYMVDIVEDTFPVYPRELSEWREE